MPQSHRPRKGSMGFSPRKRATSEVPSFESWPSDDGAPGVQGFAGYKAGMTHVMLVDDRAESTTAGMERSVPVTIVETPPMRAVAVRAYEDTAYGQQPITEVWTEDVHEDLDRTLDLPESRDDENRATFEAALDDGRVDEVRVLTHTVPADVDGVPKKRPDVMETRVGGGSVADRAEHALELVEAGGEHALTDVFRAGEFLDVGGITTGKGTQGPVKRWGVQKRKGKHARQGWVRRIGNLGPWNPSRVRSTVPQQGQMGYHQRTELNKRLLVVGDDPEEVNADGGLVNYGEVSGSFALVAGSLPGPKQRLVRFRPAVRPNESPRLDPEVRYVSTDSQQ
ncbi:MAG: 50S ribosomal protein L3 [Halobacteriaceae archaeon]